MRFLLPKLLLWSAWAAEEDSKGVPASFFLIDQTDQLCLSGDDFRRCSIDTLFYVVGSPGECSFGLGLGLVLGEEPDIWAIQLE
jgi:hypothetical protein